jgi:hypothetical protein
VNFAKRVAAFLISIATGAETALSCTSSARLPARKWQRILSRVGDFCRITNATPIVAARKFANLEKTLRKKMNNKLNQRERRHLAAVKEMPCGVCGAAGPSDAHHIEQGLQFTCIPLCKDCHQGSHNGIHGRKAIWNVTKKTELSVLNDTIEALTR